MLETVATRRPRGDEPTRSITLRAPDDVLEQLRQIAADQDRSLNAQIVRALREWLKKRER